MDSPIPVVIDLNRFSTLNKCMKLGYFLGTLGLTALVFFSGYGLSARVYQDRLNNAESRAGSAEGRATRAEKSYDQILADFTSNMTTKNQQLAAQGTKISGYELQTLPYLNLQIANLQSQKSGLNSQLSAKENLYNQLQRDFSGNMTAKDTQISGINSIVSTLQTQNAAKDTQISGLNSQIQTLQRDGWVWGLSGWCRASPVIPRPTYLGETYTVPEGVSPPAGYNRIVERGMSRGPNYYGPTITYGWTG